MKVDQAVLVEGISLAYLDPSGKPPCLNVILEGLRVAEVPGSLGGVGEFVGGHTFPDTSSNATSSKISSATSPADASSSFLDSVEDNRRARVGD
jgi:hypothetical protein